MYIETPYMSIKVVTWVLCILRMKSGIGIYLLFKECLNQRYIDILCTNSQEHTITFIARLIYSLILHSHAHTHIYIYIYIYHSLLESWMQHKVNFSAEFDMFELRGFLLFDWLPTRFGCTIYS